MKKFEIIFASNGFDIVTDGPGVTTTTTRFTKRGIRNTVHAIVKRKNRSYKYRSMMCRVGKYALFIGEKERDSGETLFQLLNSETGKVHHLAKHQV